MTNSILSDKRVAILATNGFEHSELVEPLEALRLAGAEVEVVSPERNFIRGWLDGDWGDAIEVNMPLLQADPERYDALVLPGGVMNPDQLRRNNDVLNFVRAFFKAGKPVGAICHGPWTLIDANVVRGMRVTSYHTIQADLKNAGAVWVDEPVVVDHGLVTSRQPADLPQFIAKLIEEISEAIYLNTGPSSPHRAVPAHG